ncbi:MAG: adenylosuccinate lyase [Treponema sp.]|nr:adenylosuccinate lyase [Treponema sp.]
METRSIFQNISPLDHRYSKSEASLYKKLSSHLSEDAVSTSLAKAEIALLKAHLFMQGKLNKESKEYLDKIDFSSLSEEIYEEEEKTQHNIRALVNVLKRKVPESMAPLVHLGATSADILDSSLAMRIKAVMQEVVIPELKDLELALCTLSEKESSAAQIGRTHGQHAVPITFGWSIAEFVSRLGKSIIKINENTKLLKGKLSGPVGAYNGTSLLVKDPMELEKKFLSYLNLEPSEYSHQLVEPEYILRLLLECNVAFGILANLADDLRNLQRSEIGEVFEYFSADQVGSSTMPQKRNPWNSEHVKSLWKAYAPRVLTFYMDQISEHQRDLTNSASSRFVAEYIAGFAMAVNRSKKIVMRLRADREKMKHTLENAGGKVKHGVLAEAAYILLARSGESNAHEIIRQVTLSAEKTGLTFSEELKKNRKAFNSISEELLKLKKKNAEDFFSNPINYTGLAEKKSLEISHRYKKLMEEIAVKEEHPD